MELNKDDSSHQAIMETLSKDPRICKHHNIGHCKQGKKRCRFVHYEETCQDRRPQCNEARNHCGSESCTTERHPKLCMFHFFNRCRFRSICNLYHAEIQSIVVPLQVDPEISRLIADVDILK